MAYDALERGRDIITSAVNASLGSIVTTVASAHSVTSPGSPRAVYDSYESRPSYPNIEIAKPSGSLLSLSTGELTTQADYWVIANIQGADPSWVDDACMVYLTALIRLFSSASFSTGASGYLAEPVEFDFSPPVLEADTTQKRSVGVLVRFTFVEAV